MKKKNKFYPDPNIHRNISFAKSFIRFAGYALIGIAFFKTAAVVLMFAEILGILEEAF